MCESEIKQFFFSFSKIAETAETRLLLGAFEMSVGDDDGVLRRGDMRDDKMNDGLQMF